MPAEASLQSLFQQNETSMNKTVANVAREFNELRGGRATPALVEHVTVEYYGAATPLKQLAAVTAPEPRMLVIQPWDAGSIQDIEKAILKSGLGITPAVDGKMIRLPIPPLTGERRNELTKLVHKMGEEGRVSIRNLRRDANESIKKLKNEKQISEDEFFQAQEQVQKMTDKFTDQITKLIESKEQELQSV